MDIPSVSPGDSIQGGALDPAGGLTRATTDSMGREEFLKLLMAQLEQQDPMNPVENHEFVAQLATFSSLEQQVASNQRLDQLGLVQMSMANSQLTGFIGKSITAHGDTMTLDGSDPPAIGVEVPSGAASVEITVQDEVGRVVATVSRQDLGAGVHQLQWPGTGPDGLPLPPGDYHLTVDATDAAGAPVRAETIVTGVVDAVSFENGAAELLVGGRRVRPAAVLSIEE